MLITQVLTEEEKLLELAKEIASEAHKGVFRKFGKKEKYIYHPLRIYDKCETVDQKIVAMLHDVVEDNPKTWPFGRLYELGFPEHIMHALRCLTRKKDETYFSFITHRVIQSKLAVYVKILDIQDNISDNLKEGSMKDKYRFALKFLEDHGDIWFKNGKEENK